MYNPIICQGRLAIKPYYIEEAGINIYSVEELCYIIDQMPQIWTLEFAGSELIGWLRNECDLGELANELDALNAREPSIENFVNIILEYVGYYDKEEIAEIRNIIKANSSISAVDKKKLMADMFVGKRMIGIAIREYELIIDEMKNIEDRCRGEVLHNLAVCYTYLYAYSKAAELFMEAYELEGNQESYMQYLIATYLVLGSDGYRAFLDSHPEAVPDSLEVFRRIEEVRQEYYDRHSHIDELGNGDRTKEYYDSVQSLLEGLKGEYKTMMTSD